MSLGDPSGVVGVDLGGTKIRCGFVSSDGTVLFSVIAPTPRSEGPRAVMDVCVRLVRETIDRARKARKVVVSVSVGAAGVIDSELGVVTSATKAIPDWAGTQIRRDVQESVELDVFVLNDVHAHAIGESWVGAGRGFDSVLLLTVGTGVGGAFLSNGKVLIGSHRLAGHLGHFPSPEAIDRKCSCGAAGHLEAIASGPGLHAEFRLRGGDSNVADAKTVVELMNSEPMSASGALARDVVALAATALGRAMGGLINVFDPQAVIVGGGLAKAGDAWWDLVREAAAAEVLIPLDNYVVTAPLLGEDSAVIGAAHYATSITA